MCQIRLLVIGNSSRRNADAIGRIETECTKWGDDIGIVSKVVSPYAPGTVDPNDHDLALVDEIVISKGCSRFVLGSGLPVLAFGDVPCSGVVTDDTKAVLSVVVGEAVEMGRLRDYIGKVTEHIDATRQMLASA